MAKNEVSNFAYYVFNRWSLEESKKLFGLDLGVHIFQKWTECVSSRRGELYWYCELDSECQQKLVDRANEIYGEK